MSNLEVMTAKKSSAPVSIDSIFLHGAQRSKGYLITCDLVSIDGTASQGAPVSIGSTSPHVTPERIMVSSYKRYQ